MILPCWYICVCVYIYIYMNKTFTDDSIFMAVMEMRTQKMNLWTQWGKERVGWIETVALKHIHYKGPQLRIKISYLTLWYLCHLSTLNVRAESVPSFTNGLALSRVRQDTFLVVGQAVTKINSVSFKVMQVLYIICTKNLCIMHRPLYVVQCMVFFVNPPCSWVLNENALERLL